jgi:hypothetical protein
MENHSHRRQIGKAFDSIKEMSTGTKTAMQAPYQIFKRLSDNRFVWVENIEELQEARGRLAHLAANSEAHYVLFDPRAKSVVALHI